MIRCLDDVINVKQFSDKIATEGLLEEYESVLSVTDICLAKAGSAYFRKYMSMDDDVESLA